MSVGRVLAAPLLALACGIASAHAPTDAYLTIDMSNDPPVLRVEFPLRDLEEALALDANGDNAITWGEVRSRQMSIAAFTASGIVVRSATGECRLRLPQIRASERVDRGYAVLAGRIDCADGASPERLEYQLFFDRDPTHRGLVQLVNAEGITATVLTDDARVLTLLPEAQTRAAVFASFWREGLWHVWTGIDHVLFLIALLIPIVNRRDPEPASLGAVAVDILGVVTAFTLAHSITLTLAVLDVVRLPPRLVESVIAATVLIAAVDNLRPVFGRRRAVVAFGLGLVHGLGFAGALQALGLPATGLTFALLAFNVGVECGQLALLAAVVPALYLCRDRRTYRRVLVPASSVAVAVVAALWIVERAFDLSVAPV